jgi:MYXO-CTERM domain-containing protein
MVVEDDDTIRIVYTDDADGLLKMMRIGEPVWGPGDFDGNGNVGFADFSLFTAHYGETPASPGWDPIFDLDGNSNIGFADFSLFTGLYGTTYQYAAGDAAPEPAALLVVALAAGALIRRRRNR